MFLRTAFASGSSGKSAATNKNGSTLKGNVKPTASATTSLRGNTATTAPTANKVKNTRLSGNV